MFVRAYPQDILGAQLIKRNAELQRLHERIKIEESVLRKGEQQYRERVAAINALKRQARTGAVSPQTLLGGHPVIVGTSSSSPQNFVQLRTRS